jgi:hypothetical protein
VVLWISIPGKRVDMTGVWIPQQEPRANTLARQASERGVCKLTDPLACYCLASGVDIELAVVVSARIPAQSADVSARSITDAVLADAIRNAGARLGNPTH